MLFKVNDMKKIIAIIICLLLLVGCAKENKESTEKKDETLKITNVTMSIKEGTLSKSGATIVISDLNEKESYLYGDDFRLEINKDGKWEKLNTIVEEYGFNDINYIKDSEKKVELPINWSWLYGNLNPGKYRIIKNVKVKKDNEIIPVGEINAEFNIN